MNPFYTKWTGLDGETHSGWKFACGRTFSDEFYSKTEAIESHNSRQCMSCLKKVAQSL